jgi:hypothetical protein
MRAALIVEMGARAINQSTNKELEMTTEETVDGLIKLLTDVLSGMKDINSAVTAKQLPTLAPLEAIVKDIQALVQDTAAKVKTPNPPPATPAA